MSCVCYPILGSSQLEGLSFVACPCGGINPYTLMAKLGLARIGGSGPPKDDVWPGQPDRSPVQGGKADLAINQDPGRLE